MTRVSWTLGAGLLCCLLVTSTLDAGTASALSPRDASIVGGQWTWANGASQVFAWERYGVYGTKGVAAPGNMPGARQGSVSWTDADGGLWLFGGDGSSRGSSGRLSDVWKWDGASWTWMAGSNVTDQCGSYGTKGVAAPGNSPGTREGAASWKDANGDLWLFGGDGLASCAQGILNDLWKWDGAMWTWVSGSADARGLGIYGVKGVSAPTNTPGARLGSALWRDGSGTLWLFGGYGNAASDQGYLNDLWKWDGTTWTWVSGSNHVDEAGAYGTKGLAASGNVPGSRYDAVSWTDASGGVWLFGGRGAAASGWGHLNDLWKWDGTNWTWVSGSDAADQPGTYGTKGIGAPGNVPGARQSSIAAADATGIVWVFGGLGVSASDSGRLNDLWKWDGTTWTWVSGSSGRDQYGVYGTKGTPAPENVPGGRKDSVAWTDASGRFWLFGGDALGASSSSPLNDLWSWDGNNWTWVSGWDGVLRSAEYGTKGVAAPGNVPGSRAESVSWTDGSGNLWLFGGYGRAASDWGSLNDLWKWDGTYWNWMSGSDGANQTGTYGTRGVAAPENAPGARSGAVSWTDSSGNLWLFGGWGYGKDVEGLLNDLWKWDGVNWTWVAGSNGVSQRGSYGTKGGAAPGNVPGARWNASSWVDTNGGLMLFGGEGYSTGSSGYLNDLWRWDGTYWTWINGPDDVDQSGVYGTRGVSAPGNTPGGRANLVSWSTADGIAWLFGGVGKVVGFEGLLNDLWRWDGTNWAWMSGADDIDQPGTYGTKGVAAAANVPGARYETISWNGTNGDLWLFGGFGLSESAEGELNDLWKWDGTRWTWVSGSSGVRQDGTAVTKGVGAPGNVPGARWDSVSWTDASGNLWLFGGTGWDVNRVPGTLNDLWVFGTTCTSFAPPTAGNSGPYGVGATIALTASTIDGATYLWSGPNGFTSTEQNPTIPNATLTMAGDYGVTVVVGGCTSEAGTTTVVVLAAQTLTVTKIGAGAGSIQSSPVGIDCGSACSALFAGMTPVTLTATADALSRFAGWAGEGCRGTDPCTVTMDGARSVSAMFLPSGGVGFHTVTPCRIVDTRNAAGPYGGPPLEAGTARAFGIAGQCGVPADASAVALNVTVTNPTSAGHLTIYPGTGVEPGTSTVSFSAGRTRANNASINLIDGLLTVFDHQESGTTHLIIDVSGYFR